MTKQEFMQNLANQIDIKNIIICPFCSKDCKVSDQQLFTMGFEKYQVSPNNEIILFCPHCDVELNIKIDYWPPYLNEIKK